MKTVLIVDDFRISNEVVAKDLREMDFEVIEAQSADQAMKYFDGRSIDLVICDYQMPRTTGIDLARKIRALKAYKNIPIVVLSAKKPVDDKVLKEEKITAWIRKPLDKEKLNKIIRTVF